MLPVFAPCSVPGALSLGVEQKIRDRAAGLEGVETFPENLNDFREVDRLGEMKIPL